MPVWGKVWLRIGTIAPSKVLGSASASVVFNPVKNADEVASMKDAWSNPVTHTELFCVPKYFVGVKAESRGS
jgi:hypothetical protein